MPTWRARFFLFSLVWLLTIAGGLIGLARYEQDAGSIGKTPAQWPAPPGIALDPSRPTLLMFAHPKCPCTRASMEELNRLLARSLGMVTPHVVFFKPEKDVGDWAGGALWESAKAIPSVIVDTDTDGAKARLFGAETSGYVVVYDPHCKLLFHGGITAGRGHAGDNAGESAILSLLTTHDTTAVGESRVFGCALLNPHQPSPVQVTACTK
ncbi:MAG TPA: hypothetical protein VK961_04070 [Chthoniobacter sp.]|nr:hypothetical protein [Chthoniobacter sp.]